MCFKISTYKTDSSIFKTTDSYLKFPMLPDIKNAVKVLRLWHEIQPTLPKLNHLPFSDPKGA